MKKLDTARFFRNGYKAMRTAINKDIIKVLMEAEDNEIQLDGHRGSLTYCIVDHQENEVIRSLYLKYSKDGGEIMANVGIYKNDYTVPLDDMSIEMVLNIMDAVEKAVNTPE